LVDSGGAAISVESVILITKHKPSTCHLQRAVHSSKMAEHAQMNESRYKLTSHVTYLQLCVHTSKTPNKNLYTHTNAHTTKNDLHVGHAGHLQGGEYT